jgi:hypothetical protein
MEDFQVTVTPLYVEHQVLSFLMLCTAVCFLITLRNKGQQKTGLTSLRLHHLLLLRLRNPRRHCPNSNQAQSTRKK